MADPSAHAQLSPRDLESILAVTRALASPFELRPLLKEITAAATHVLHAERCSVWLLDRARDELLLEVADDLEKVRIPLGKGLIGSCARDLALINVPDCYADPRFDPSVDRRSGFRTRCSLTLPLVHHDGTVVGAMQVLNAHRGAFDANDEALARALAAQCAVALQRVRMTEELLEAETLRRELELARAVQMSTLPAELPSVRGYDMHATFRPASLTGGDTYDLAWLGDQLLVVLGDASGHGIGPALSVTQMHAMLRMAFRMNADLETAFRQVNDQLAATLPDSNFVTAFIGLLEPDRHRLRFLSGGQSPILHFHFALGRFSLLKPTSFPMGAMPLATSRSAVAIELAPGDLLALASDGIYEQENAAGEPFGVERFKDLLATLHEHPADEIAARLIAALDAHAGGMTQDDDVTMVIVKRLREVSE